MVEALLGVSLAAALVSLVACLFAVRLLRRAERLAVKAEYPLIQVQSGGQPLHWVDSFPCVDEASAVSPEAWAAMQDTLADARARGAL